MKDLSKDAVSWITVTEAAENQRIDNFLIKLLKGVPKSHIYRIVRSGEVRVNSKRIDVTYRLQLDDKLRIPPIQVSARAKPLVSRPAKAKALVGFTLYEDEHLLALNKPPGIAVHGGSGISFGVIEQLRAERPELKFLELVHRLDRETSGVLLLAKKRGALVELHRAIREGEIEKYYLALVKGVWRNAKQSVKLPLHKYTTAAGERRVSVTENGRLAHTVFYLEKQWPDFSLLWAELQTGRTHQIRVHLAHLGFPIVGDDKYGDFELNKQVRKLGLSRMYLHACKLTLNHPITGKQLILEAPLFADLQRFASYLDNLGTVKHSANELA